MFVHSDSGLRFEVTFRGKDEFEVKYNEIEGKAWILADSEKDIYLDFKCFQMEEIKHQPDLLLELYIDGVLRNVVKPRTGRGLAEKQISEATIDRGVVLTEGSMPLSKKFRFVDLNIDDAVLSSRQVNESGTIEIRVIQAGDSFNEEDDISFELPGVINDRGTLSLFCGELNNTIGIRFDEGDESVRDTKEIRLQTSIGNMVTRQNEMLGETVAIFAFNYASDAILLHLGMIPPDHKKYDAGMASERSEVRTRCHAKLPRNVIEKAIFDSDYCLSAKLGEPNLQADAFPSASTVDNSLHVILPTRPTLSPGRVTKRKGRSGFATPQKGTSSFQVLLTPPITPEVNRRMDA